MPTSRRAPPYCTAALLACLLAACDSGDATGTDDAQPRRQADVSPLPAPAPGSGSVTGAPPEPATDGMALRQPQVQDTAAESTGELAIIDGSLDPDLVDLVPVTPAPSASIQADAVAAPFAESAAPTDGTNAAHGDAAAVVQAYYAAIGARDYAGARALWADGGRASGQSPAQFAAGFASTREVAAQVGTPSTGSDGDAVQVPVSLVATQADGSVRRYAGQFVMERAPGAQPGWRIAAAQLREERL